MATSTPMITLTTSRLWRTFLSDCKGAGITRRPARAMNRKWLTASNVGGATKRVRQKSRLEGQTRGKGLLAVELSAQRYHPDHVQGEDGPADPHSQRRPYEYSHPTKLESTEGR